MVGDLKPDPAPVRRRLEQLDKCPLCDGAGLVAAPVQPEPPFGLTQCGACGIIFLSPRPPADAMNSYYDAFYDGDDRPVSARQQRRAQRHLARLQQYFPSPGRLLEIGAGDGYFLKTVRDAGWQVEGLEVSQPRVARALEWFGLRLRCCDLSAAGFEPASFDAVGMFQLLEHLHDPRALLQRVHALLKPRGIVMLSTPNVLAYARKHRDVNSWRIPRHLFFFSPRTLVRSVENCGFEVLRRPLKLYATLEERLNWRPWPNIPNGFSP
jgi:SAM-dependent methyltransferase